jgi:hypothetical protein
MSPHTLPPRPVLAGAGHREPPAATAAIRRMADGAGRPPSGAGALA